jgi:UDP-2,3-diacylglucosamine hydrolase
MDNPTIVVPAGKKIYFASDFHLGSPSYTSSLEREKKIIRWLESARQDAHTIFILGDIFDFWFEYRHSIPKGYTRLLGTFASISDSGIPIKFFTGNHDMWMFDYFTKELGIPVYRKPVTFHINGLKLLIGHGDGLGPGDWQYKLIKKIFENRVLQWMFGWIHPNIGIPLANGLSKSSRDKNLKKDEVFHGDKEWLIRYCRDVEHNDHHDLYVFGHRHYPLDMNFTANSRYINTGDWINHFTYAQLEGNDMYLKTFEG